MMASKSPVLPVVPLKVNRLAAVSIDRWLTLCLLPTPILAVVVRWDDYEGVMKQEIWFTEMAKACGWSEGRKLG